MIQRYVCSALCLLALGFFREPSGYPSNQQVTAFDYLQTQLALDDSYELIDATLVTTSERYGRIYQLQNEYHKLEVFLSGDFQQLEILSDQVRTQITLSKEEQEYIEGLNVDYWKNAPKEIRMVLANQLCMYYQSLAIPCVDETIINYLNQQSPSDAGGMSLLTLLNQGFFTP